VVHTASPYQLHFEDPVRDCLDPAIKGTTGILKSIHAYAPTVKRVVITSSSAAVLGLSDHPKVYDESRWCDVTWEQATDPAYTYRASKVGNKHP
jgi:nucleoside-diphosphate-sugar epimerase